MKLNKLAPKKNVAQAMVEFAIVLPILLMLIFGLLEAGRLLFMYSSIVTASRQASRYGATTGQGSIVGIKRFQDCDGIRLAANKVDYLSAFDHMSSDIVIEYDSGPNTTVKPICAPGVHSESDWGPSNDTRIIVTVKGHFKSLVPKLVPFMTRDITTKSARTILVSIPITVPVAGAQATTTTVTTSPNPSATGQLVTISVNVTAASGTPTGTVNVSVGGAATCTITLINGAGSCPPVTFTTVGTVTVSATYVPADSSFTGSTGSTTHIIGKIPTTTTITDTPDPSVINTGVNMHVVVTNNISGMTVPTGSVTVTTAAGSCTAPLSGGQGDCTVTYTTLGTTNIQAVYNGDTTHEISSSLIGSHEVLLVPATPSKTSEPNTAIPSTALPPTPVANCNTIRDAIIGASDPIKFSANTMYLNIPNTNPYQVTLGSIYVAWNYDKGHIGSNSNLKLQSITLTSATTTTIWTGDIHQPNYTASAFTSPAIIPANGTSKITFVFDQIYNKQSGEQIQLQFSTPGCEAFPVLVPIGSSTPIPPSVKLQAYANGTDNNQQTQFTYRVQNTGSASVTNLSVRIYFTLDGSNASSNYTLEKYYDQSGAATVSGPTLLSGTTYYFTVSYGSTSLAAGSAWEYQGSLRLVDWGQTYSGTNDWWHGSGMLPGSYTDWASIPVYQNTTVLWGSPP